MSEPAFPFPTTPLSRPFWEAAEEGRFIAPRCKACDRFHFAPEIACPHCFSTDWEWVAIRGTGEVYTYTVVHRPPSRDFTTPFVLAAVDLPEGITVFSHIVDCAPEDLSVGMKVTLTFRKDAAGRNLPVFRPQS